MLPQGGTAMHRQIARIHPKILVTVYAMTLIMLNVPVYTDEQLRSDPEWTVAPRHRTHLASDFEPRAVVYHVLRGSEELKITVPLAPVPFLSIVRRWTPQLVIAFFMLVIGTVVFAKKPDDLPAQLLMLFCYSIALQYWGDGFDLQLATLLYGQQFCFFWSMSISPTLYRCCRWYEVNSKSKRTGSPRASSLDYVVYGYRVRGTHPRVCYSDCHRMESVFPSSDYDALRFLDTIYSCHCHTTISIVWYWNCR